MKDIGIEFCDNKEIFYSWDDGEYYLINGTLKKIGCLRTLSSIINPMTRSVKDLQANGTRGVVNIFPA